MDLSTIKANVQNGFYKTLLDDKSLKIEDFFVLRSSAQKWRRSIQALVISLRLQAAPKNRKYYAARQRCFTTRPLHCAKYRRWASLSLNPDFFCLARKNKNKEVIPANELF